MTCLELNRIAVIRKTLPCKEKRQSSSRTVPERKLFINNQHLRPSELILPATTQVELELPSLDVNTVTEQKPFCHYRNSKPSELVVPAAILVELELPTLDANTESGAQVVITANAEGIITICMQCNSFQ